MPGCDQGNDSADDSRTAAIGTRNKQKLNRITKQLSQTARGRRSRRNRKIAPENSHDFVPRGATFTSASLPVDGDPTTSSDHSSDDSGTESLPSGGGSLSAPAPSQVKMQPAVNWNKVAGGAIRTSLRGSGGTSTPVPGSFDAVNWKYWRSRSASLSSAEDENRNGLKRDASTDDGKGTVANGKKGNDERHFSIDGSEDSELESDAAADNSILLNMSIPNQQATPNANITHDNTNDRLEVLHSYANVIDGNLEQEGKEKEPSNLQPSVSASFQSQENTARIAAFESFSSRYPNPPHTLTDLSHEDRDVQFKYIYYNSEPRDVDLNLPIRCTDCMAEGHLSDICPDKECKHCGTWDVHESRFCPSWRRCQRCRERGHDEPDCPSLLKGLASEVPCDLCGSSLHIESECDLLWKVPKGGLSLSQIFISVCCSFCTSKQHLLGDCPIRPFSMNSSSWTLRAINPSLVANLGDNVLPVTKRDTARDEQLSGLRIKGRANEHMESDEDDSHFSGSARWKSLNKQSPRAHIRFGTGIGRGRNLDEDSSRQASDKYISHDYRRKYRDRDQYSSRNIRRRSLSPDPYPSRQRSSGANRYGPTRSPPRGRPPPPLPSRGNKRNKRDGPPRRGRRGGKSSDTRDAYRPMPSAAKQAWDKHRL
ncbi:hypothetical protein PRK78_006355 [Emydomyces testavorans]|uniref:CCHC-type domain-containing protein n=1 Tax=Emydomyces testavorans TaxID=2070801 RepID=A0AAF0ILK1_9EURO|nr:hypothetical protein PRK78_006355 [Emydomyces testavorans]